MDLRTLQQRCFLLTAVLCILLLGGAPVRARTRLVVWGMPQPGVAQEGPNAEIAAFAQRHPEIEIVTLSMGAGAMNPQKLMTAIVGGVPPDLVLQDRFTVGDWASRGAFRPVDDLIALDARRTDAQAIHQSNFVPATWAETVYRSHVYAIPWDTDDRVLYYNKAEFRDAGLDPNRPPRTWDEMIADAKKLTVRTPGGYKRIGFIPLFNQGWLYLWSWQNDGEFMSPDGRRCTLANPQTADALAHVVSWYDELGGIDAISAYASGFGSSDVDAFISGQLAMEVNGDTFLFDIARYNPALDFGVCAVPVPADRYYHRGRFKNDATWVTWSGGYAFAMPVGCAHPRAAWEFIQWMDSPEANLIGAHAQADYERAQGRLYVPSLFSDRRVIKALYGVYASSLPPAYLDAEKEIMALLPQTRFRPVTFVGQRLWDEQVRAVDAALRHEKTPEQALLGGQTRVQIELDTAATVERHPLLPARRVVLVIAFVITAALLAVVVAALRWRSRHRRAARAEAVAGFGFVLPWVIGFLVLTAGPIVASLIFSFCDYDVLHPPRWAGLSNYRDLVTLDRGILMKSLGNATYLAVFGIPLGMATSLTMAMLLNAKIKGQAVYRTCFYVPSVVPVVASTVLWGWLLNGDPARGLVNGIWEQTITPWFHVAPPGWLAVPSWAKPSLILIGLWGAGGGMILWLAGLQSIPSSLYEAACIDGAGPVAQFRHITLPMLSPYIFFNVIVGTIGALQTFETAYILGNTSTAPSTGPDDSLLVPVVYLFNNAFQYFKMGYASALAWILFIMILGLTLGQVKLAPRWVHYETDQS